jgi:hypothetical protein
MNTLQLQFLMLTFAGWVNRGQQDVIDYLLEENRVLREQLGRKRLPFTDRQRRRLAVKAKEIGRKGLFEISTLVTPDTLLRWYRRLISRKYDGSKSRTVGRPRIAAEIEELILQTRPREARLAHPELRSLVARQNSTWGYTRIRGALYNLGHNIGRNTIKRILLDHGLDPAPLRGRTMSWETFLKPSGVKTVRLPARSPNLNAYAERFVRSIKSESLVKMIPLGERHLRKAVKEYTEHYHLERNHQGLDNELNEKLASNPDRDSAVECRERLGGILNYYYRRAA